MKHGYGQALTFTKICHKVKGWDDSLAVWTEKKTSKKNPVVVHGPGSVNGKQTTWAGPRPHNINLLLQQF